MPTSAKSRSKRLNFHVRGMYPVYFGNIPDFLYKVPKPAFSFDIVEPSGMLNPGLKNKMMVLN